MEHTVSNIFTFFQSPLGTLNGTNAAAVPDALLARVVRPRPKRRPALFCARVLGLALIAVFGVAGTLRADGENEGETEANQPSGSETVTGNIAVGQNLHVAQLLAIGSSIVGETVFPAATWEAVPISGTLRATQFLHGENVVWEWVQHNPFQSDAWGNSGVEQRIMTLSGDGRLSLYPNPPNSGGASYMPAIVLDASDPSLPKILLGGEVVLTTGNLRGFLTSPAAQNGGTGLAIGDSASTNYYASTAVGAFAYSNDYGTSLGYNSLANGHGATAQGYSAIAEGYYTTAIGCSATTKDNASSGYYDSWGNWIYGSFIASSATAVGASSRATADYSTAIGYYANASRNSTLAAGENAVANGQYATALGSYASAGNDYATAIGYYANACSRYGVSIGYGASSYVMMTNSYLYNSNIAIGYFATAIAEYGALAIGSNNYACADYSLALGTSASVSGASSIAIGGAYMTMMNVSGSYSIAIGKEIEIPTDNTVAIGRGLNTAQTDYSAPVSNSPRVILGSYNKFANDAVLVIGDGTDEWVYSPATGTYGQGRHNILVLQNAGVFELYNKNSASPEIPAIAFDFSDTENPRILFNGADAFSSSMNTSNIASEESTAIGNSALAYGANSIAIGNFVSVYADETITIGNYSYSTAYGSVLIGHNLQTSGDNSPQVIFGRNNEPVAGGVFSIGNGTGAWLFDEQAGYYTQDRSNLLLIMEDGRTILRHRDYPAPTGTGANDSATPPALPTPQKEALRVQGNATVDGIFRVRPAGDIGMGPFTEDDGL